MIQQGVMKVVSIEDLGKVLALVRKKTKGITQVELAKMIDRSSMHISNVENGEDIRTDDIKAIAKALGVKVAFIVSVSEEDIKRLLEVEL